MAAVMRFRRSGDAVAGGKFPEDRLPAVCCDLRLAGFWLIVER